LAGKRFSHAIPGTNEYLDVNDAGGRPSSYIEVRSALKKVVRSDSQGGMEYIDVNDGQRPPSYIDIKHNVHRPSNINDTRDNVIVPSHGSNLQTDVAHVGCFFVCERHFGSF
jgi:hypothetical protein